jgi:hypothetical protein
MTRAQAGGAPAPRPVGIRRASGSEQARCWPVTGTLKLAQNLRLRVGSRFRVTVPMHIECPGGPEGYYEKKVLLSPKTLNVGSVPQRSTSRCASVYSAS